MTQEKVVLDEDDIRRTLVRIAHEIVEKNADGDVAPDGTTLLMTRGTYRLDELAADDPDPAAGTLRLPLFGNQWPLEPGHRIRLDLMQVDESAPFVGTFQRSKVPDTISFGPATLELPLRQAADERLGAQGGTAQP